MKESLILYFEENTINFGKYIYESVYLDSTENLEIVILTWGHVPCLEYLGIVSTLI